MRGTIRWLPGSSFPKGPFPNYNPHLPDKLLIKRSPMPKFLTFLCSALLFLMSQKECSQTNVNRILRENRPRNTTPTKVLAVYEPWFGHPRHIDVGYSSQDPVTIKKQIEEAKKLGITGFVIDWYGDREPFLDKSYALLQSIAAEQNFNVAMMFDEANQSADQATDDALAAFDTFHKKYLSPDAPGRKAYLEYRGRPVIFIFPKGGRTDWNRVRTATNQWSTPPLLTLPGSIPAKKAGFPMAAIGAKTTCATSIMQCRHSIRTRSP